MLSGATERRDRYQLVGDILVQAVTAPERWMQALLMRSLPHLPDRLTGKIELTNPWLKEEGESARDKILAHRAHQIIPDDILEKLGKLQKGADERILTFTKDLLAESPENGARMKWSGFVAGVGVTLVQNGEKTLGLLGVPHPEGYVLMSQAMTSVLINMVRWRASRNVHSLNRNYAPVVGADLQQIFAQSGLSMGSEGIDLFDMLREIKDGYVARENNERFLANLDGFAWGLLAGNVAQGRWGEGIFYAGATWTLNELISKGYPVMIGKSLKELGEAMSEARTLRDQQAVLGKVMKDSLLSERYMEHVAPADHRRREMADRKNSRHYTLANLAPVTLSALAQMVFPESGLAANMYTASQAMMQIFVRMEGIANLKAQEVAGNHALGELDRLCDEATGLFARVARIRGQQLDRRVENGELYNYESPIYSFPDDGLGVLKHVSRDGEVETEMLSLVNGLELRPNELILVVGQNYAGKTSLLKTLAALTNYQDIIQLVPSEDHKDFGMREELIRAVYAGTSRLGEFTEQDKQRLIFVQTKEELANNPIVKAFFVYARKVGAVDKYNISLDWLADGRTLSGAQQLVINTLLAFLHIPPPSERSVIMFDDPMGVLTDQGKQDWCQLVTRLMNFWTNKSGAPTIVCAANDVRQDGTRYLLGEWAHFNNLSAVVDLTKKKTTSAYEISAMPYLAMLPDDLQRAVRKEMNADIDLQPELMARRLWKLMSSEYVVWGPVKAAEKIRARFQTLNFPEKAAIWQALNTQVGVEALMAVEWRDRLIQNSDKPINAKKGSFFDIVSDIGAYCMYPFTIDEVDLLDPNQVRDYLEAMADKLRRALTDEVALRSDNNPDSSMLSVLRTVVGEYKDRDDQISIIKIRSLKEIVAQAVKTAYSDYMIAIRNGK